jgi:dTDP-4-dehydrorhamnose reductase
MKYLITGSNGLLGQKIVRQLIEKGVDFLATSLGENRFSDCPNSQYQSLDITDQNQVDSLLDQFRPDAVINTAAMTNVDACEEDSENCRKINVQSVVYLKEACARINAHLIQLSTDFVFDGENGPYAEEAERNPLSVYAQSKVDAENVLIEGTYQNWSILRTIIVFGRGENLSRSNIVLWATEALQNDQNLTIVNDQFRAPTWADDLAWACIKTAELNAKGVFHIAGPETMSVYELVCRIAKFHGLNENQITPISSSTLNQKAKRPPRTGFDLTKAKRVLGYKPKTLEECLKLLMS